MDQLTLFYILATVLGLVVGSFYNVCIHRGLTGESVINPPRSKCPKCGHFLAPWENIPLLSYLLLRGRCHSCKAPISARYPIVEALSGAAALLLALKFGPGVQWAVYTAFTGLFIVLSFIDLDSLTLPLVPLGIGAVSAWVLGPLVLGMPFAEVALGSLTGAGLFWLIRFAFLKLRGVEGMGIGDVYLMLTLGALTGLDGLPLTIILSAAGLILASILFRQTRTHGLQARLPFGPFLCLGTFVTIVIGPEINRWWMALG